MIYGEEVLGKARKRLEKRRESKKYMADSLRREVYEKLPRVGEIDKILMQTTPKVIAAAFRKGEDPQEAIKAIRQENMALQEERIALLAGAGYRWQDLEETPNCPDCKDSGWQGATMCHCFDAICKEAQLAELSKSRERFESFRLDYYSSSVGEFGRSPRQNMEQILSFCRQYVDKFGKSEIKNLLFYGGTGLGKTFLSSAVARELSLKGYSVVYDTATMIFNQFEEEKFSRDMELVQKAKKATEKYLHCDLLVLDDLGSEMTSSFVHAALYQLINSRLMEGRATIISTNLTMADLEHRYSQQVISRVMGEYEALLFFGKDIRILRKNGEKP